MILAKSKDNEQMLIQLIDIINIHPNFDGKQEAQLI